MQLYYIGLALVLQLTILKNKIKMNNTKILKDELDTIVSNARKALFDYIIKVMSKMGIKEINFSKPIEFPNDWDEDNYYMTVVTGLTLYDKNDIWVKVDDDGSYDEEKIQLYSIDEIIVMASKLTKQ